MTWELDRRAWLAAWNRVAEPLDTGDTPPEPGPPAFDPSCFIPFPSATAEREGA